MEGIDLQHQTQAPTLVGVAVGFIAATVVIILLRMYTRIFMLRMAGPDDWSILVATVRSLETPSRCAILCWG